VLARRAGIEMPIAAKVSEILYDGRPPRVAVDDLLARPLKEEG
jgi:glycerol-3-phosphate dehydrogenase (NAD(P)+)